MPACVLSASSRSSHVIATTPTYDCPTRPKGGYAPHLSRVVGRRLETFEDCRGGEGTAGAHGDERELLVGAFELVQRGRDEPASGRADRVAEGDGAAVDVDLVGIDAVDLLHRQHDRGER